VAHAVRRSVRVREVAVPPVFRIVFGVNVVIAVSVFAFLLWVGGGFSAGIFPPQHAVRIDLVPIERAIERPPAVSPTQVGSERTAPRHATDPLLDRMAPDAARRPWRYAADGSVHFDDPDVQPGRDDAQLLREYTMAFDASFLGLHADPSLTLATAREFRAFYERVRTGSSCAINHTALTCLFDHAGRLRLAHRHVQAASDIFADLRILMRPAT
jgi:hypothetical protein